MCLRYRSWLGFRLLKSCYSLGSVGRRWVGLEEGVDFVVVGLGLFS